MKPINLKKLSVRLGIFMVFIIAAFIIHSCKKDIKLVQISAADSVNEAKTWYESTYPVNTNLNSKLIAAGTHTPASTGVDYSQFIKPDWNHSVSYRRFNKAVIELPVDPSAAMNFSLKNKNSGQTVYSKENGKTSFILLNDGKGYTAYMMTILADPVYLGNDRTKLAHNTFRKHDADFTGMVFYFTPKGQFVRSYAYKQGKLIVPTAKTTTLVVNSVKKVAVAAAPTCIDWFWTTWANGEVVSEVFLYETCDDGGGSGGGGSPPPTCTPPGTNSVSHPTVNITQLAPPDPGDGSDDPGYPDPTPNCSEPPPFIPCLFANTISSNNTYNSQLSNLNGLMSQNYEADYTFGDYSNANSYSFYQGNANEPYVSYTIANNSHSIMGTMHTHPTGMIDPATSSPVVLSPTPTPGDFTYVYNVYNAGAMVSASSFTSTIVTAQGKFLIQINNEAAFSSWAATNLYSADGTGEDTQFYAACAASYRYYINNNPGMDSLTAHELALLDNLNSSGMELSIANPNGTWTALVSGNGTVYNAVNPCNN